MYYLKNVFIFFLGVILFLIFILLSIFAVLRITLHSIFILIAVILISVFLWWKNKILASGWIVGIVILFSFAVFVAGKAKYEDQMFEVSNYSGRILITSTPPEAEYVHMESGLKFVKVAGLSNKNIYYWKKGTMIATSSRFPNVKLQVAIKSDTKKVHFNFYLRTAQAQSAKPFNGLFFYL